MRGPGLNQTGGSVESSSSGNMPVRAARRSFSWVSQYRRSFEIVESLWRVRDKYNVVPDASSQPPLVADEFMHPNIRGFKVCMPAANTFSVQTNSATHYHQTRGCQMLIRSSKSARYQNELTEMGQWTNGKPRRCFAGCEQSRLLQCSTEPEAPCTGRPGIQCR
jgi:hypothetical protein